MSKKALIVGINKYPASPLSYCINDAKAINDLLLWNEDGSSNFSTDVYTDIPAKAMLKEYLYELFRHEHEIALFYFSGHGCEDECGFHIATRDGVPNDVGVSMSDLMIMVNGSPAKNKIIILDCCHAGGFGECHKSSGTAIYLHDGITVLLASKAKEKAYEVNGHGIFTNLLLEALKGGAADLNGDITPGSIYAFVDKALGRHQQRPVFKTNVSEFVSLRKVIPQVSGDVLQQIAELFPTAGYSFPLDPSFEFKNDPKEKQEPIEPYAKEENVKKLKDLQKLTGIGLVAPEGEDHMYFAAMHSKSCRLTPLGQHYWRLMRKK